MVMTVEKILAPTNFESYLIHLMENKKHGQHEHFSNGSLTVLGTAPQLQKFSGW